CFLLFQAEECTMTSWDRTLIQRAQAGRQAGSQAEVGSAQPYQWLTHWNVLETNMSIRLGGWPPVGEVGEDRLAAV
ncbi:hypothetical protein, partial [Delftia acidovorans]|uniref:hypothetical protein n=1 Tax=Delftia acidovorans TaxID=80866 RepID=UPI002FDDF383